MNFMRHSNTFQFEEDPFAKNVQGIGKQFLEVSLLKKFLQTKPHVESMNIKKNGLYKTVIKKLTAVEYDEDYCYAERRDLR